MVAMVCASRREQDTPVTWSCGSAPSQLTLYSAVGASLPPTNRRADGQSIPDGMRKRQAYPNVPAGRTAHATPVSNPRACGSPASTSTVCGASAPASIESAGPDTPCPSHPTSPSAAIPTTSKAMRVRDMILSFEPISRGARPRKQPEGLAATRVASALLGRSMLAAKPCHQPAPVPPDAQAERPRRSILAKMSIVRAKMSERKRTPWPHA